MTRKRVDAASELGLREEVIWRVDDGRRVVKLLRWYDPQGWTRNPDDPDGAINKRVWELDRMYASPIVGGSWYYFGPNDILRHADGSFTQGVATFFWAAGKHAVPRLYPQLASPEMEPDDLRYLGLKNHSVLAAMWPRLRELLRKRR